ncbi:MAG: exonuclease, partial [Oscillospiraceae bacterium]|nr:exonuclease [Oscillospiraceae bacterium]
MERIIAFDVETPNHFNNSICSIGIAIIENGRVVENQHYLVDPEADFDYQNIMIHGIYPEDVYGAPTFPQLWQLLAPVMRSGILCAHNAV